MSEGFSADWLALREPCDAAARSPVLAERLRAWCHGRGPLRVLDLGAGTGANLRWTAPLLGGGQAWTLVELDPALIAAGEPLLAAAEPAWRYRRLDLARDLEALADEPADLFTASALLDLVGEPWLAWLVRLRAAAGAALYLALSYDGRILWDPVDEDDATVAALVNRHQRTDKGFGPALGPEAVLGLRRALADAPGELLIERADWRLGPADGVLQAALLAGWAEAATAIAPEHQAPVAAWAERRGRLIAESGSRLVVGHLDVLFLPAA